jgi:hypothetical protein
MRDNQTLQRTPRPLNGLTLACAGGPVTDIPTRPIQYEPSQRGRGAPRLIRVGASTAVVADVALPAAIFIWNGGRIWGPYLNPPVTVSWAQPIAAVSLLFGLTGIFASGVGVMRPSPVAWKVVAALASCGYLVGVVCVIIFGLL